MSYLCLVPSIWRLKLSPKADRCTFLGFTEDSDACRFLDLSTNSIIEVRDEEFYEDKFIKDKGLLLNDILENTKKSIALYESVSPEAEGVDV